MITAVEAQMTDTARNIESLGRRHNRRFRFIMKAGTLVEPLYWYQDDGEDYYIIPREQDTCDVPREADQAVGLIKAAGYRVVQQIIAHEVEDFKPYKPAPRQADTIEVVPVDVEAQVEAVEETLSSIGQALATGAKVVGKAAAAVATGVATGAAVFGIFTLMLIDPALIVVVEQPDGTHVWIEVANWIEA